MQWTFSSPRGMESPRLFFFGLLKQHKMGSLKPSYSPPPRVAMSAWICVLIWQLNYEGGAQVRTEIANTSFDLAKKLYSLWFGAEVVLLQISYWSPKRKNLRPRGVKSDEIEIGDYLNCLKLHLHRGSIYLPSTTLKKKTNSIHFCIWGNLALQAWCAITIVKGQMSGWFSHVISFWSMILLADISCLCVHSAN